MRLWHLQWLSWMTNKWINQLTFCTVRWCRKYYSLLSFHSIMFLLVWKWSFILSLHSQSLFIMKHLSHLTRKVAVQFSPFWIMEVAVRSGSQCLQLIESGKVSNCPEKFLKLLSQHNSLLRCPSVVEMSKKSRFTSVTTINSNLFKENNAFKKEHHIL